MTPKEKIQSINDAIAQLQNQLAKYKKSLIDSVTEKKKGHMTILTTSDGTQYVTRTQSNNQMGRDIWDESGNRIAVDVRSNMRDVKLFVATYEPAKTYKNIS